MVEFKKKKKKAREKKKILTIVQSDVRNVVPLDGGGQTVDRVPGHTFRHLVQIITAREQIKPQCKNKENDWKVIGRWEFKSQNCQVMNKTLNLQFLHLKL